MDEQRIPTQQQPTMASPGLPHQRRFDGAPFPRAELPVSSADREPESWVEVSSQPSSSSLSSIGDEIVTTGLRVGPPFGRRRRLQTSSRSIPQQQTAIHNAGGSSQEEYDESESEEEHILTSSTENVQPSAVQDDSDADSDEGDNATALGRASDRPVFHPQPNAFSHPPAYLHQRSHSTNTAIATHPHSGFTRPSFTQRSQTRVHRGGPSFMSPSAREDNDAALRASLTTLLSCAAAARGLPKSKEEAEAQRAVNNGVGPSVQPVELRLVPESELLQESTPAQTSPGPQTRRRRSPAPSSSRGDSAGAEKPKRPTSTSRSPRVTKKKKTAPPADETLVSPTLLTWVVSAGVVVLVSVVGFGAGYVIGREVGKHDALAASVGSVNETASCGREVMRTSGGTLRRFRWGDVGRSIVAQS